MMEKEFLVKLDLDRSATSNQAIEMRHNDNNRLILEFYQNGDLVNLNSLGIVTTLLAVKRLDKQVITLAGELDVQGRVSYILNGSSLSKEGMVEAVAQFYDANDVRISGPTLVFSALKDPTAEGSVAQEKERTYIEIVMQDGPVLLAQLQTAYDELQTQKAAFAQFQEDSDTAFSNAQNQRSTDFSADQAARNTAFEDAQTQRATDFNISQGERATLFNQTQMARQNDYQTWKDTKDTELNQLASDTENSKLAADGATANANNAATAANTAATNANNKVTELNGYNTRLQGVETETANARQSAVKNKNFANVDTRFEELEGDTYIPMKNEIVNGDFSQGTTGWPIFNATHVTSGSDIGFLANSQNGRISQNNVISNASDVYYQTIEVKADSPLVRVSLHGSVIGASHSGSNNYERLSLLQNGGKSTGTVSQFQVLDGRASGWTNVYVRKALLINLTQVFGAGNEPTQAQMDALLATYPTSWFDGTVNLAENKRIIPFLLKRLELKADKTQEAWITPTLLNGATAWNSTSVGYLKDTLGFVHIQGRFANATAGAVIFQLPLSYRPSIEMSFIVPTLSNNSFLRVTVSPSGEVRYYGTMTTYVEITLSFKAV